MTDIERSPIEVVVERLVQTHGLRVARAALRAHVAGCSVVELAAANYSWPLFARPKQVVPAGDWRSCGFMTGRGFGKTRSVVSFALQEIEAGRARRIALVGQNEAKCIQILITGETGFLELTPPWLGVTWEPSTLTLRFGNGAVATVYTACEPTGFNGPQHDLALATEVAYWPASTGEKALDSMLQGLRLGAAKLVWDSTPRRRDRIIRRLLAQHAADPARHLLIEGATGENALNLSAVAHAEFAAKRGTPQGEEDWFGRFHDELENGMFVASDLDRPHAFPSHYTERVIAIDPSTAGKKHSDQIGIIEAGLGDNGICYVLSNLSGKHDINAWPDLVLDRYAASRCSLILLETNHAGTTWQKIFSDACKLRGWQFRGDVNAMTTHTPGSVNFCAFAVGNGQNKAARAQSAANWVRAGRVSFVDGALGNLKEELCDFTGADNRPDDQVDAFVHVVNYLMRLQKSDPAADITGIGKLQQMLTSGQSSPMIGRGVEHAPARGATTTVAGHRVAYDGSRGMRELFGSGGSDRIGGR